MRGEQRPLKKAEISVCGVKVPLLQQQRRNKTARTKPPENRRPVVGGRAFATRSLSSDDGRRRTADVNISVCGSSEARCDRLRRIQEAVEIEEEFKRFLGTLDGGQEEIPRELHLLSGAYEELFGNYFDQLKELVY